MGTVTVMLIPVAADSCWAKADWIAPKSIRVSVKMMFLTDMVCVFIVVQHKDAAGQSAYIKQKTEL
jgi:hypothetical protein